MMSLSQLLTSPEWFPDAIYADRGLLDCYQVNRQLLGESPFLDERMTSRCTAKEQAAFTDAELASLADGAQVNKIGFIFHTSFCRSTLMAQALHVDGLSFTFKEPSILLSLAESIRYTQSMRDPAKIRSALPTMLRLATGLANHDEKTVFKPTNFANNLLPYVAESGAKILLMYSDLRSYLISILKYGERGRAFTRQLYIRLMADCDEFRKLDPRQALSLTDLKIATLVWQQQIALFMRVMGSAQPAQVKTLSSDLFGTHRNEALAEAFRFFGIPVQDAQLKQILAGPVFQQHSKSGKTVDDHVIQRQSQDIAGKYQDDLDTTLRWAQTTSFASQVKLPLPNSLIASGNTGL